MGGTFDWQDLLCYLAGCLLIGCVVWRRQKNAMDMAKYKAEYLLENWTPVMDLMILLKTVGVVLRREGSA